MPHSRDSTRSSSSCEAPAKDSPKATLIMTTSHHEAPASPNAGSGGGQNHGDLERQTPTLEKSVEKAESQAPDQPPPAVSAIEAGRKLPQWRLVLVVLSLCIGTLLVAIDTTIVSTAIPHIATDFKALDDVGWYGAAYLFTVTAFQPAFGSIYRFFDAKWTYLASVVLFESRSTCRK